MRQGTSLLLFGLCTSLTACVVVIDNDPSWQSHHHHFSVPASELAQLNVDINSGNLFIEGVDGLDEIHVNAEIKTISDHIDAEKYINKEQVEQQLTIQSAGWDSFDSAWHEPVRINLHIQMPKHLILSATQGSGNLKISQLNNHVSVDDGSGNIRLWDIAGHIKIDDTSGNINLKNIIGNVMIDDNSGDIKADKIQGTLSVADTSGDIKVSNTTEFKLLSDTSGQVALNNMGQ